MASIGLDIGLSIAQLEAKQDQLEQYLKELNDGIAETNQDLTDLRREVREINLRIYELLNTIEPKQTEESWDNWVADKTEELKQLRSRLVSFEGIRDTAIKLAQNTKGLPYDVRVKMIAASDPSIFKILQDAGKDENLVSDQRKEKLDDIRDRFSNSVAQQMKAINQELTSAIADHKSLSILEPYAQGIIDDANDFGLSFPLPDRFLERKAEETKNTLDIAFPDREKLKTVDEILEGLKILIAELQETPAAVA